MAQLPQFGPQGTSYVVQDMELTAIDATGHEPPGWPVRLGIKALSSDGYAPTTVAVGPDGTVYVAGADVIEAFHADGSRVYGWPKHSNRPSGSGFVATVLPVADGVYSDIDVGQLTLLGKDGAPRPGWPVPLPIAHVDAGPSARLWTGPDGTLYVQDYTADAIWAYSSNGAIEPGWPLHGWSSMAFDPGGRIYVWKHVLDLSRGARNPPVTETQIAAVDSSGRFYPGWPLRLAGAVSSPAFGSDGTVYATRGGPYGPGLPDGSDASAKLVALDRNGNAVPGWPVSLPNGYWVRGSRSVSDPPSIATNGSVYVLAATYDALGDQTDAVFAVLPDGRPAPGWPRAVDGSSLSNALSDGAGSGWLGAGSLVHLISDNRILGLKPDGTEASGWPLTRPCGAAPESVRSTPDGGLLVIWNAGSKPYLGALAIRYLADGSISTG
jgi:hypothetical protein